LWKRPPEVREAGPQACVVVDIMAVQFGRPHSKGGW
jgi:hypothetical protein